MPDCDLEEMSTGRARELLDRLYEQLERLDPDVAAWAREGIDEYRAPDSSRTLCVCLRLRGQGKCSPEYEMALATRNEAIRRAFAALPDVPDEPPKARYFRFYQAIVRFEGQCWSRERKNSEPSARLTGTVDRELFWAFRAAPNARNPVPKSLGYLRAILDVEKK